MMTNSTPKKRILIVEDDPDIVEILTFHLGRAGYATRSETNGSAALKKVLGESWDAVLLDVMLPSMSGIDICRSIR